MTEQPPDRLDALIRAWCIEQLAPWRARRTAWTKALEEFGRLNSTEPNVFLIEIADGRAVLAEKPLSARHQHYGLSLERATSYRDFLGTVARMECPELQATLAIYVGDGALSGADHPVFAFQKPQGNPSVLLPDVEMLASACYSSEADQDRRQYEEKSCTAVFYGSTTGGLITADTVRAQSHPRLRAAAFFRDFPEVQFRLPSIVQADSEGTVQLLRALGHGDGARASWQDQTRHRFVIAIDGNGAGCSRVARGLLSNSVLLKYASPHVLYYFSALQPWLHYVPIQRDADVIDVIAIERADPGAFAHVAAAGQAFAREALSPSAVRRYVAALLREYPKCFQGAPRATSALPAERALSAAAQTANIMILAHIENFGDRTFPAADWVGRRGSGLAIEGLSMQSGPSLPAVPLSYQAVLDDGTVTPWSPLGTFCGTRGKRQPLRGFAVRVDAPDAAIGLYYSATFVDGSEIGPLPAGQLCRAPSGAALESFRLLFVEQPPATMLPSAERP